MTFYMPTRVYEESNCVASHAAELAALGTKAMLVTGRHSAKANGSEADVVAALTVASVVMVLVVPYSPLRDWIYMEPMTTRTVLVTILFVVMAYPVMWVLMKAFDKAREFVETRRAQRTVRP